MDQVFFWGEVFLKNYGSLLLRCCGSLLSTPGHLFVSDCRFDLSTVAERDLSGLYQRLRRLSSQKKASCGGRFVLPSLGGCLWRRAHGLLELLSVGTLMRTPGTLWMQPPRCDTQPDNLWSIGKNVQM